MKNASYIALRIAVIYAIFGACWIILSDTLLADIASDTSTITHLQTFKGWFYVAITAMLVYYLVLKVMDRQFKAEQGLQSAQGKILEYVAQLEESMQGTLQAISNMVEQRDPYTAGHERRVGTIAADIAREMGWEESRCANLQLIGLVHDIGKIGIPAEILSKPTRLTALEYDIVKEHVRKGYEILKNVKFPLPIADIIYQHHERMNGSGYPHGLEGGQILPEARILAVADVIESMASHRPYRPALGVEAAVKEITDHRGTLYDVSVVDAFLRLVGGKKYRLPA